jgi:hypothetical protein
MKSMVKAEDHLTTLKVLNMNTPITIQLFQSCGTALTYSVDFIYGYSYSTLSALWVCYVSHYALIHVFRGNRIGHRPRDQQRN